MPELATHKFKIRFDGGIANKNLLPLYDGTTSIQGIGQSLQIATHAFMTGEIVTRATALRGAHFVIRPARPGSFIVEVIAVIEAYPAMSGIVTAIGAPVFYDFIKTAFRRATGDLDAEPETAHLKKIYSRREPPPLQKPPADLDELAETLEGSLQRAHRPIGGGEGVATIEINTPRQQLIELNANTKDWVNTREEAIGVEVFTGNVTRYNSLSRNGRAYIDQLDRVLPMRPGPDYNSGDLPLLTWSLHGSNAGLPKKLQFRARRVSSANGRVKRLLLVDNTRIPET
ncbi:MAG: hypothetical protein RIE24_12650 [Silicimonas sp.]